MLDIPQCVEDYAKGDFAILALILGCWTHKDASKFSSGKGVALILPSSFLLDTSLSLPQPQVNFQVAIQRPLIFAG